MYTALFLNIDIFSIRINKIQTERSGQQAVDLDVSYQSHKCMSFPFMPLLESMIC